jgi:hypothetical protein
MGVTKAGSDGKEPQGIGKRLMSSSERTYSAEMAWWCVRERGEDRRNDEK